MAIIPFLLATRIYPDEMAVTLMYSINEVSEEFLKLNEESYPLTQFQEILALIRVFKMRDFIDE